MDKMPRLEQLGTFLSELGSEVVRLSRTHQSIRTVSINLAELGQQLGLHLAQLDGRVNDLEPPARTLRARITDLELENRALKAIDLPVQELELSVRSANCLFNAKIETVRELVEKRAADLLRIRNFTRRSLDEIEAVLGSYGLFLKPDADTILDADLKVLVAAKHISVRLANALYFGGYQTFREVVKKTRLDLRKIKNFGPKALDELEAFLALHDMKLAEVSK